MEEWFTSWKIPLGPWLEQAIDWFRTFAKEPIGVFSDGLEALMEVSAAALYWLPPLVLILIIAGIAHLLQRSWRLTIGTTLALMLIANLGLWEATVQTLALIIYATLVSMLIGVPLGIWAGHRPAMWAGLRPILDLMQTIPTFVYLIPMLALFSLGYVPGLVATIVFALPAPVRLTYLGITSVPKALIEAGEAFGATKRQLLWKVELPSALPTIMAGVTQCIMLSLSMVVVAALVGTPGLGVQVVRALNSMNMKLGFESGLALVVIAILLDRVCKQRPKSGGEK